ncbi:NAD(P)H-hydrate dehydratase [Candidatus Woesearchaeota archaeon]|nr:NAD(P)H-hydrate dehydratase [Candidatus Woesearchaeota archaeon]
MQTITKAILKEVYQPRKPWVHKGQYGKLAIIGGSRELTGSCCFAGMAAYRAGCDVAHVIAPQRAADVAAYFSPNLITIPVNGDYLTPDHLSLVISALLRFGITAIVLGPGLGRAEATMLFVRQFLMTSTLPIVIDADGIRALHEPVKQPSIITPHAGEFLALTKQSLSTVLADRVRAVSEAAHRLHATILAKGHVDIISDGQKAALNKTGSLYMTKGGMGDTLAGIAGALLARGIHPFHAACAAAYINGAAGQRASTKKEATLATDLLDAL